MYGHITRVSWIWCTFFWFWHHSRQFKELLNVTQGQVPICMALEGGYEIKVTQRKFFWKCFVRALKINYWAHWMNISGEHAGQVGAGGDKGCPGEASWSHVSCINVLNHYCQKSGNFNWSIETNILAGCPLSTRSHRLTWRSSGPRVLKRSKGCCTTTTHGSVWRSSRGSWDGGRRAAVKHPSPSEWRPALKCEWSNCLLATWANLVWRS